MTKITFLKSFALKFRTATCPATADMSSPVTSKLCSYTINSISNCQDRQTIYIIQATTQKIELGKLWKKQDPVVPKRQKPQQSTNFMLLIIICTCKKTFSHTCIHSGFYMYCIRKRQDSLNFKRQYFTFIKYEVSPPRPHPTSNNLSPFLKSILAVNS